MTKLKNMHNEIADMVEGKKIGYIDIPMHFNIGDLLIYLGTEEFFKKKNLNIVYRSSLNFNLKKLDKVDVIMFHGGGNFGDLYEIHQSLRESIIKKFPNKKIICLPQSIHFNSIQSQKKSATLFMQHPDFHFYVRDKESFKIAQEFSPNAKLMPDMAHSLHPLVDISEVNKCDNISRILNLRRNDIESVDSNFHRDINKRPFDWDNIISPSNRLIGQAIIYLNKFAPHKSILYWKKMSETLLFESTNYFYIHDAIYSDRLHGIILSTLLGKKIKLYDNSYGKNQRYFSCWLNDYPFLL
ncbi:polysaccharide pyruvyl transferase family protein [Providencia vermicola]|uniref:Polysaccharide pyruvyl transferase family protein n=1 Tax=Providencia vermicola TaxID=333965 RepID=A0AAX3RX98_9GAMM|nr:MULTISPECIES: polysaccharide pyruvyl transferase family protein [Providencia]USB37738.1 polysaccharide pyruvyl transferase family protein [Providencia vermicola]WFC06671.1 polysaccharide pyruvyl transferase family protein [Providencia vermicola]